MPKLKWEQFGLIWEASVECAPLKLSLVVVPRRIAVILDERSGGAICLGTSLRTQRESDIVDAMQACETLATECKARIFGEAL